jgi:hypothetical protein
VGTVLLKSVHLIQHAGESAIYAGGIASSGIAQLHKSEDEGANWTMLSAAFPAGYKPLDWEDFWGGGFGALASNGTGLYTTRSMDGVTWSAPLLVYTAPSGTPKGVFKQMTKSGESHFYITDMQTYSIRNDDTLQTVGVRIF